MTGRLALRVASPGWRAPVRRKAPRLLFFTLALLPPLLAACGLPGADSKPLAVTSFYPVYFLTSAITGERMTVRNLAPAGVEPHDWEPSPRDMADLTRARVFAYNGAGFEVWVTHTVAAAPSANRVDIEASKGLTLASAPAGDQGYDPHVWLDPVLAGQLAATIAGGLIRADPAGRETYQANLATLQGQLGQLDQEFKTGLATCQRRDIVTSHAAFGYLARRYGLNQIAVEGLAPNAEPTPSRLAEVANLARERGATYIFFETLVSPRVAETIAREIGAKTLVLDPLEGVQDPAKENYVTVMRQNLANLRTALACQ